MEGMPPIVTSMMIEPAVSASIDAISREFGSLGVVLVVTAEDVARLPPPAGGVGFWKRLNDALGTNLLYQRLLGDTVTAVRVIGSTDHRYIGFFFPKIYSNAAATLLDPKTLASWFAGRDVPLAPNIPVLGRGPTVSPALPAAWPGAKLCRVQVSENVDYGDARIGVDSRLALDGVPATGWNYKEVMMWEDKGYAVLAGVPDDLMQLASTVVQQLADVYGYVSGADGWGRGEGVKELWYSYAMKGGAKRVMAPEISARLGRFQHNEVFLQKVVLDDSAKVLVVSDASPVGMRTLFAGERLGDYFGDTAGMHSTLLNPHRYVVFCCDFTGHPGSLYLALVLKYRNPGTVFLLDSSADLGDAQHVAWMLPSALFVRSSSQSAWYQFSRGAFPEKYATARDPEVRDTTLAYFLRDSATLKHELSPYYITAKWLVPFLRDDPAYDAAVVGEITPRFRDAKVERYANYASALLRDQFKWGSVTAYRDETASVLPDVGELHDPERVKAYRSGNSVRCIVCCGLPVNDVVYSVQTEAGVPRSIGALPDKQPLFGALVHNNTLLTTPGSDQAVQTLAVEQNVPNTFATGAQVQTLVMHPSARAVGALEIAGLPVFRQRDADANVLERRDFPAWRKA